MGIVFMQVSMLKLNAGIGRAVQSAATLERQNANLRAAVSGMESGTRIDGAARHLGMVVPADGSTHYVTAAARGLATAAAQPDDRGRSRGDRPLQGRDRAGRGADRGRGADHGRDRRCRRRRRRPRRAADGDDRRRTGTAPTGTVAAAPTAAATTAPPAATTTPPPATAAAHRRHRGARDARRQTADPAQTQQAAGTPTAASTSGGAVAPPQG